MTSSIKILSYWCIGLSCSAELHPSFVNLLETVFEKGLSRCLVQHPISRFTRFKSRSNTIRFFSSSSTDSEWNTGHVPLRRHNFNLSANDKNEGGGKVTWHFDPLRSLYYYFRDLEPKKTIKQNSEIKKPFKQDDDMVVYNLSTEKKSPNSDQIIKVTNNPLKEDDSMVVFSTLSARGITAQLVKSSKRHFSIRGHKYFGNEVVINSIDGRREVKEPTNAFPWSIHGHLRMEYSDKIFVGSGILVNHCHVLTAGHCLYGSKDGVPDRVTFYPGKHGAYTPWTLEAKYIIVHPLYHKNEDTDSDLGMIILEDQIGKETGWARLKKLDDTHLLEGLNVDITGYPKDKFVDILPYMYTMKGPVKVVHNNRFYYDIDTSGGQSGSGVCVTDVAGGDIVDCLGIHTTGSKVEGNGATRINIEKLDKIKKWVTSFPEIR